MPITPKSRQALHEFWADVRAGKRDHPSKQFWDEVKAGKRPHPTKGKKHVKNNVISAPVTFEHLEHLGNNAKPIPFTPEKPRKRKRQKRVLSEARVTILDKIKIATLQLVEIDSVALKEIEETFNSIPECDRVLMSLDQLMERINRLHNLVAYCRKIHHDTLERMRAHHI